MLHVLLLHELLVHVILLLLILRVLLLHVRVRVFLHVFAHVLLHVLHTWENLLWRVSKTLVAVLPHSCYSLSPALGEGSMAHLYV